MFVRVFTQILDSTIADDFEVRHIFEDLLKLCDREGLVDMTEGAIARRTGAPIDMVKRAIVKLLEPDPQSRSAEADGARIVPIDPLRAWGWRLVNYQHYRAIRDAEDRRAYFTERKRIQRARPAMSTNVLDNTGQSNIVTHVDVNADVSPIRRQSDLAPSVLAFPGLNESPTDDSEVPDFGVDEIVPQASGKRSCIRSKWISDIFDAYPKREDPDAANKAIRRALQNLIHDGHDGEHFSPEEAYRAILNATSTFASSPKVQRYRDRGEMQFVSKPASWFSKGGHKSDPQEWK